MVMHLHVVAVVVYGTERNWIFVYYEEENVGFYAFAAASPVVYAARRRTTRIIQMTNRVCGALYCVTRLGAANVERINGQPTELSIITHQLCAQIALPRTGSLECSLCA